MENKFRQFALLITAELADQRIDKVLPTISEVSTRSQALKLLQQGLVRLAGRKLKPSYLTQLGETIDVSLPQPTAATLQPYNFSLVVPYEDEDLLVVDKPAGLVVHPAYGHAQDTLVNALLHHTKDLSLGFNEVRPGLVHRIDKDTSGLLVIAKNETAQRELALQFQRKTTHRIYRAMAYGKFKPANGVMRSFLRRHPDDRKRVASVPEVPAGQTQEGKLAVTHYRLLSEHPTGISLVELKLETGRTHQIRVHLSEMGHPIVGDKVYGSDGRMSGIKSVSLRKSISFMSRFALHAAELGFVHPRTGVKMRFRAPWPEDLIFLIKHCDFPVFDEKHFVEKL